MQFLSDSPSYLKSRASEVKSPATKENITKENPGNYPPISLSSMPAKVMEQILMKDLSKHLEDRTVARDRQHGFTKGRSA